MVNIFTSLLLGFLMILDPCTLFTSIAAIGYIDKEINNRRKVFLNGLMFVLGKLATYTLLAIPFIMGARTDGIKHFLHHWGEPMLAAFMLICGLLLLFTGRHHHEHDHGMSKWLKNADSQSSGFWSFMLGIFFAIAFCPHRLVYFFTMIDIAITLPFSWNWVLPIVFGLGTGLPIMIIAWLISYSAVSIHTLTSRLHSVEKWVRYVSAALFIGFGIYLCVHIFAHGHKHECGHDCGHQHCELLHTSLSPNRLIA
jgi:cytochrome c biogenesis protein CcdA